MSTEPFRTPQAHVSLVSLGLACCISCAATRSLAADVPMAVSAANYPSLQAAIDANPGGTILIPAGEHKISEALAIRKDGTALTGFGRIVQTDAKTPVVLIDHANNVVLRDLTLARPADAGDTNQAGVLAIGCDNLRIEGVHVLENHSYEASIRLQRCSYGRIENCYVQNYRRIGVDDRTGSDLYGYAFRCIDGTGIDVTESIGTFILNNQIIERRLISTPETKEKYHLGDLIEGKHPTKYGELGRSIEKSGWTSNWHQGAAIHVSSPEQTTFTRISGNYIENSAQGMDIHSDNYICSENTVNHGMMGMKAMHGSRNGIISNNIFSHVDNWGIMLGPGAASHDPEPAKDGKPARPANTDGTVVVSGNIISDFGRGWEFWNWGGTGPDAATSGAILIERGQIRSNPSLSDVLIVGNIVGDTDEELDPNGQVVHSKPRYKYAIVIDARPNEENGYHFPKNIRVVDNLFAPGQKGICNIPLPSPNGVGAELIGSTKK
jgi:hypothetical protein